MERRDFIFFSCTNLLLASCFPVAKIGKAWGAEKISSLTLSKAEWKQRLTKEQYDILREEGTEPPFTSPLLREHREGTFACVACDLPLFLSTFKYESGTGWPSFFDTIPGHLATKPDHHLVFPRTEYHCARCSGHHGHVFDDGPKPTGLRYCNNGAVLKFMPKEM